MKHLTLSETDLDAVEQPEIDGARWLSAFPFTPDRSGETLSTADNYTVVYNEMEPGTHIGTHQDGVDEIVYVI